jgi:hypothetical protein
MSDLGHPNVAAMESIRIQSSGKAGLQGLPPSVHFLAEVMSRSI